MRQTIILILLLNAIRLFSQSSGSSVIDGRVVDAQTGEPVPYASVGIEGTTSGTSTNVEGYFTLRVPNVIRKQDYTIKISCVGFENERVKNPGESITILLRQSKTMLRDVVVFGKDLSPEGIVRRAFKNIKRNYYTKPFVYQTFYRHYCKDDSVYGRLIEAAVEIYKRKGYKIQQPNPGYKEEVRVNQLRRSVDNTKVASSHVPMALYSIMGVDPVGYQAKGRSPLSAMFGLQEVSVLLRTMKDFTFSLEGLTEYDGQPVYEIHFQSKNDSTVTNTGFLWRNRQEGKLYINTEGYAIVRYDFIRKSSVDTIRTFSIYNKVNGKYYLHHSLKDGYTFNPRIRSAHNYHIELLTTNILTKDFAPFKGKEPGREELFAIEYDSTFWNSYNILRATPLEESIEADLERGQSLPDQFKTALQSEKEKYFSGKEDEEKFNRFLETNRGIRPVYIDFWASWCGPCIREMPASLELIEKYKTKVAFVYLSLDDDIEAWRKAIRKYDLEKPFMANHFRIGSQADAVKIFEVNTIPRYVLVNKQGRFVDLDAARPSDSRLQTELDHLLAEKIED